MIFGPHHVIGPPSTFGDMIKDRKPAAVLYLDPSDSVPWLAPLTVGRFWIDTPVQDEMLNDPVASGIALADRCIESSRHNGITIWQGLNEPPAYNYDTVQRLCQLELARVQRLEEAGLTAAVLAFGVGWPAEDMTTRKLTNEWYAPLMSRLDMRHYVMFHQYWRPTGPLHRDSLDPDGYPSLVDRQRHWTWPHNIIIGECGIDIGGQSGDGWKGHCPPYMNLEAWCDIYVDQCRDFQRLLSTDKRVKAGWIYTHGQYGWWSFETGDHWRQFAPLYSETLPEPIPEPEPERIRVKLADGSIADIELEEYLRGVVPAEMYPSWDMEALQAGAVWARAYAIASRRLHREAWGFDVYADTRSQGYNPALIHPRTDQAVKDTAGIVLVRDGEVLFSEYKAYCGRADCLKCNGQPGTTTKKNPDGHWPGQGCQWGAAYLAGLGYTWDAICKAYYANIQIVDYRSSDYTPFAGNR